MKRFTVRGSSGFERRFARMLAELASDFALALQGELRSLILAGGYGRGEGAILCAGNEELPYNDLDLIPIVRRPRRRWPRQLEAVRRSWQSRLGIHVDLARPLTESGVRNWPHWLLWHDVMHGHRVLWGDRELVARAAPTTILGPPPAIEASRLLLNRGAGLVAATRARILTLPPDPTDPEFVRRNAFKADLAMMDAVLLAHGRYGGSVLDRPGHLGRLADENEAVARLDLLAAVREAVRFKIAPSELPTDVSVEDLGRRLDSFGRTLCHVEAIRTGLPRPDLRSVAEDRSIREPERHRWSRLPLNLAQRLRQRSLDWRSPRESLFQDLAALLAAGPGSAAATPSSAGDWCAAAGLFYDRWTALS